MKRDRNIILIVIGVSGTVVFTLALIMLFFGDRLDSQFNVIGIRVATAFIAFSAFLSSMLFSLLILLHNKTAVRINDDTNRRAELFREIQFSSSNYSIIDFMDRMLIYSESDRYIERAIVQKDMTFHMLESSIVEQDVYQHSDAYVYVSIRIPFRVVEGKIVSSITFDKLRFEREGSSFEFLPANSQKESRAYILYNEQTKRNNVIMNLIVSKQSDFYKATAINKFTKIKIFINIISLLGVKVTGTSELYFTNPEQIEGDGKNTYRINSSNFVITAAPRIESL